MNDVAINAPLIAAVLGITTTIALTIRNGHRGKNLSELFGHLSIGVFATSVIQFASVLSVITAITITTTRPIPTIDRVEWLPASAFSITGWLCLGIATLLVVREARSSGDEKTVEKRRSWKKLAFVTAFIAALQWMQIEAAEFVGETRLAILREDSQIAFRAATVPERVNALRSLQVHRVALTRVGGNVVGVAVDKGGAAIRWNASEMRTVAGVTIALPRPVDIAFALDGFVCSVDKNAQASCKTAESATNVFMVEGHASTLMPSPVCHGHVRACALIDDGVARCFEAPSGESFRNDPLPLKGGIRAMTAQFGCMGCFVQENGHVRCLARGVHGEVDGNEVAGIDNAVSVASSLDRACAIERGGAVFCWDLDQDVFFGSNVAPWKSWRVPGLRATQVAVAQTHACAVEASGSVYCWGDNHWGELCDGSRIHRALPVRAIDVSDAMMVSVENDLTCIVHRTGDVSCCGKQRRLW